MPMRKLPEIDQLARWLASGKTQQQIVDLIFQTTGHKVGRSAVAVAIHRAGLETPRSRPTYKEWLPWTVIGEHSMTYPAVMLRAYARSNEARELDRLPDDLRVRLINWLANLEDNRQVIDYNHDDGFVYVPRRAGETVIRRPTQRGGRAPQRRAANE